MIDEVRFYQGEEPPGVKESLYTSDNNFKIFSCKCAADYIHSDRNILYGDTRINAYLYNIVSENFGPHLGSLFVGTLQYNTQNDEKAYLLAFQPSTTGETEDKYYFLRAGLRREGNYFYYKTYYPGDSTEGEDISDYSGLTVERQRQYINGFSMGDAITAIQEIEDYLDLSKLYSTNYSYAYIMQGTIEYQYSQSGPSVPKPGAYMYYNGEQTKQYIRQHSTPVNQLPIYYISQDQVDPVALSIAATRTNISYQYVYDRITETVRLFDAYNYAPYDPNGDPITPLTDAELSQYSSQYKGYEDIMDNTGTDACTTLYDINQGFNAFRCYFINENLASYPYSLQSIIGLLLNNSRKDFTTSDKYALVVYIIPHYDIQRVYDSQHNIQLLIKYIPVTYFGLCTYTIETEVVDHVEKHYAVLQRGNDLNPETLNFKYVTVDSSGNPTQTDFDFENLESAVHLEALEQGECWFDKLKLVVNKNGDSVTESLRAFIGTQDLSAEGYAQALATAYGPHVAESQVGLLEGIEDQGALVDVSSNIERSSTPLAVGESKFIILNSALFSTTPEGEVGGLAYSFLNGNPSYTFRTCIWADYLEAVEIRDDNSDNYTWSLNLYKATDPKQWVNYNNRLLRIYRYDTNDYYVHVVRVNMSKATYDLGTNTVYVPIQGVVDPNPSFDFEVTYQQRGLDEHGKAVNPVLTHTVLPTYNANGEPVYTINTLNYDDATLNVQYLSAETANTLTSKISGTMSITETEDSSSEAHPRRRLAGRRPIVINTDAHTKVYSIDANTQRRSLSSTIYLDYIVDGELYFQKHLAIIQLTQDFDNSDAPSVVDDDDDYWNTPESSGTFTIIDDNSGADYGSYSLLYKSNSSNIYTTIEQKDNTLFAGSYHNNQYDFKSILNDAFNSPSGYTGTETAMQNILLYEEEGYPDWYNYKPVMTLPSSKKKLFKKGESYKLGIVFVDKQGRWSDVYYNDTISNYAPETNPKIIISQYQDEDLNTIYRYTLNKEVYKIRIGDSIVNRLLDNGIVAAFPVYALKNNHAIQGEGILCPVLKRDETNSDDNIKYFYSYKAVWNNYNRYLLVDGVLNDSENYPYNLVAADIPLMQYKSTALQISENFVGNAKIKGLAEGVPYYPALDSEIFTFNSPEIELQEGFSDSYLEGSSISLIYSKAYTDAIYRNRYDISTTGITYPNSQMVPNAEGDDASNIYATTDWRWEGLLNMTYGDDGVQVNSYTTNPRVYHRMLNYMWDRDHIGSEPATHRKKLLNYVFIPSDVIYQVASQGSGSPFATKYGKVFRNYDYPETRVIGPGNYYQGNVDHIVTYKNSQAGECGAYRVISNADLNDLKSSDYPHTNWGSSYYYSNYNYAHGSSQNGDFKYLQGIGASFNEVDPKGLGFCYDPVSVRYKSAPHAIFKVPNLNYAWQNTLNFVQLSKPVTEQDDNDNYLAQQIWIKCGELRRLNQDTNLVLTYEEGDYFYGRYDSLRVEPYAAGNAGDTNQNMEVISFMCSSRVNLDARTDIYRGVLLPVVNHTNFNRFNKVYDQPSNYFTFQYIREDPINSRTFNSSVQWSMTKQYGEEIDSWLNIQDSNTLDLDGDKGSLTALVKVGNDIMAFQETGIAQILYNEKTQVSVQEGVPVEIANSGKVDGKYYLYNNMGCQNKFAIAQGMRGTYFVDSINRTIYIMDSEKKVQDLCVSQGMRSWGLKNLNESWWAYYDLYSQEVLFISQNTCLAYSDAEAKFSCFLSYDGVRWHFHMNKSTYIPRPGHVWKKNAQNKTVIFGQTKPLEIEFIANPEPLTDKTFTTIEYRADAFNNDQTYLQNATFKTVRVSDEFQDTGDITLYMNNNLSKKFRIWRIDIPRTSESFSDEYANDRIRNPWCKIKLKYDWSTHASASTKFKFYDTVVSYLI